MSEYMTFFLLEIFSRSLLISMMFLKKLGAALTRLCWWFALFLISLQFSFFHDTVERFMVVDGSIIGRLSSFGMLTVLPSDVIGKSGKQLEYPGDIFAPRVSTQLPLLRVGSLHQVVFLMFLSFFFPSMIV